MIDDAIREFFGGRRGIVTGGTGGIGSELVAKLEEAGSDVIFTYTTSREHMPPNAYWLDQRHTASVYKFWERMADNNFRGGVDYLILNAAKPLEPQLSELSLEAIYENIAINLSGTLAMIAQSLHTIEGQEPMMAEGARIILVGSALAEFARANTTYAASKAGLRVTAETLSRVPLLKQRKIRAGLIELPYVDTPMSGPFIDELRKRNPERTERNLQRARELGYYISAAEAADKILQYAIDVPRPVVGVPEDHAMYNVERVMMSRDPLPREEIAKLLLPPSE